MERQVASDKHGLDSSAVQSAVLRQQFAGVHGPGTHVPEILYMSPTVHKLLSLQEFNVLMQVSLISLQESVVQLLLSLQVLVMPTQTVPQSF